MGNPLISKGEYTMTNILNINKETAKLIINSFIEMKIAEKRFEELKKDHLKDLGPGEVEYPELGKIQKLVVGPTSTLDYKKLYEEHKELFEGVDLEQYRKVKNPYDRVIVTSMGKID